MQADRYEAGMLNFHRRFHTPEVERNSQILRSGLDYMQKKEEERILKRHMENLENCEKADLSKAEPLRQ